MNKTLEKYARDQIKHGLLQLTEDQQLFFKRIYSHKNTGLPINNVVDLLPDEKLDWAMQQVERTLQKNALAD